MATNTDLRYKPVEKGLDPDLDPFNQKRENEVIQKLSCLVSAAWNAMFCCCLPFTCCCNVHTVSVLEETHVTKCGIPVQILRKPGPYCVGVCCTETKKVYVGLNTHEIKHMAAADDHGSPIVVSAHYDYRIRDSRVANYRSSNLEKYLYEQAESALRTVMSLYPYDIDRNAQENISSNTSNIQLLDDVDNIQSHPTAKPCLSKHSTVIEDQLKQTLQRMIDFTGIKIVSFRLVSVGYEKSMEKLLLARQEAQAQVIAKQTIAEGATGIVNDIIKGLKAIGIDLPEREQHRLIVNLTMLMVNHGHATINMFDGGGTTPIKV